MRDIIFFLALFISLAAKSQDSSTVKVWFKETKKHPEQKPLPVDTLIFKSDNKIFKFLPGTTQVVADTFIVKLPKGSYRIYSKAHAGNFYDNTTGKPLTVCPCCKNEAEIKYEMLLPGDRREEQHIWLKLWYYRSLSEKGLFFNDFTQGWSKTQIKRISKKKFTLTGFVLAKGRKVCDVRLEGSHLKKRDKALLIKSFSNLTDWCCDYGSNDYMEAAVTGTEIFEKKSAAQ